VGVVVVAAMVFYGTQTLSHTHLGTIPSLWFKPILALKIKARSLLHRPLPMLVSMMAMVVLKLPDSSTNASFLISMV